MNELPRPKIDKAWHERQPCQCLVGLMKGTLSLSVSLSLLHTHSSSWLFHRPRPWCHASWTNYPLLSKIELILFNKFLFSTAKIDVSGILVELWPWCHNQNIFNAGRKIWFWWFRFRVFQLIRKTNWLLKKTFLFQFFASLDLS